MPARLNTLLVQKQKAHRSHCLLFSLKSIRACSQPQVTTPIWCRWCGGSRNLNLFCSIAKQRQWPCKELPRPWRRHLSEHFHEDGRPAGEIMHLGTAGKTTPHIRRADFNRPRELSGRIPLEKKPREKERRRLRCSSCRQYHGYKSRFPRWDKEERPAQLNHALFTKAKAGAALFRRSVKVGSALAKPKARTEKQQAKDKSGNKRRFIAMPEIRQWPREASILH